MNAKVLILLFSLNTMASFLPKNDLQIPASFLDTNKYETEISNFKKYLDNEDITLNVDWDDPSVNAYASIVDDLKYVTIQGGLLRHPSFNSQVLYTILCHEVGHHQGGHPYKKDELGLDRWSSVEGKCDYFATNSCLKKFSFTKARTYDKDVVNECKKQYSKLSELNDYEICLKIISAAKQTAQFSHKISSGRRGNRNPYPKLINKDKQEVSKTFESHPTPQCRLDTLVSGFHSIDDNEATYPKCWYHQ